VSGPDGRTTWENLLNVRTAACVLALPCFAISAFAQCGAAFDVQDFSDPGSQASMTTVGTAAFTSAGGQPVMRLTSNVEGQSGAVWYTLSKASLSGGFNTVFQFRTGPDTSSADGFAFVIQNQAADAIGDGGSGIGYASQGIHGITRSLTIEFDTFNFQDEFDSDHVSLQTNGNGENQSDDSFSLAHAHIPFNINDGQIHTVKISYDGASMQVFVDDMDNALIDAVVDLTDLNGDNIIDDGCAWVGFTAGTGLATADQDIVSWQFNDAVTCVPVNVGSFDIHFDGVVGQRIEQHIVVTGSGPKTYQWVHDDVDMQDDGRITGSQTDHLIIDPVLVSDRGHYDFHAGNPCSGLGTGWDVTLCGRADFDGDGDIGTDSDISAFFACLGGSCCPTCGSADFNADGDIGTDADIETFFRVLAGGHC
jgi:hypothetical protein